jgi:hypothetical protein
MSLRIAGLALLLTIAAGTAEAQPFTGQDIKNAGKTLGHGVENAGHTVGNGLTEGAHKTGHALSGAGHKVSHGARHAVGADHKHHHSSHAPD